MRRSRKRRNRNVASSKLRVWFVLIVTTTAASTCCLASAALVDSTASAESSSDEQEREAPSSPTNWKTKLGEHRKNLLHAFQSVPRMMTGGTRRPKRLTKQQQKDIKFLVATAAPSSSSPSAPVTIHERNVAVKEHSSCRRMAHVCEEEELDVLQILGDYAHTFSPEPYVGMVLRAFNVDRCLDASGKSTTGDCGSENEDPNDLTAFYELLEPVQLELGVRPKHWVDFAYKPVLAENRQGWKNPSSASTSSPSPSISSTLHEIDCPETAFLGEDVEVGCLEPIFSSKGASPRSSLDAWWQWWFIFMGLRPSSRRNAEEKYERTGDRAFAGGSHGEVWRGRRKCHVIDVEDEPEKCDETRPLILKRLKVEYGVKLLEAGLREIYFGHILANNENDSLFTKYVDHFFRESSVPFRAQKALELWIVFEDAGSSLRSYLYTPLTSGGFVLYQHSAFWKSLRMSQSNNKTKDEMVKSVSVNIREFPRTKQQRWNPFYRPERRQMVETGSVNSTVGRLLMREVLRQLLESAAYLHSQGIVHRDIKPSNFMCKTGDLNLLDVLELDDSATIDLTKIACVLGDFSSAWDEFADQNLYSGGLSSAEQTIEYAPPEAMLGPSWIPFVPSKPESYDSWSIGVVALEMLLGTPNVFSVDQRTRALLSNKMKKQGATEEEIERALYLAALSQFCIYTPEGDKARVRQPGWPLRYINKSVMTKQSCTMHDFHRALRARDPLGIGFDSKADTLLHLIWSLLTWDPMERSTAAEALRHPYFTVDDFKEQSLKSNGHKALESLMLDPRVDIRDNDVVTEFTCPKCGRKFEDWRSCHTHARSRRHANFCDYNRTELPTCLNAHTLLPADPLSGYCDIQGRRRTIEDFHTVHLNDTHQFFGVFDGHTGNLAPKYAASKFPDLVHQTLSAVDASDENWKEEVGKRMETVFLIVHENFLNIVASSPVETMDQSGTTASIVYLTDDFVVVSSVGDSRTIMSVMSSPKRVRSIQLTKDHVASDIEEKELVESRGAFVSAKGGLHRVNGTLAITRSIGDAALSPVLSRTPSVVAMSRQELKEQCGFELSDLPCFIIQASDGLWDVMENDEAVEMVIDVIMSYEQEMTEDGPAWFEGGAVQEAAERLTQEAYVRGSTDNIGVSVIAIT